MNIIRTAEKMNAFVQENKHKQIGFVPTMGFFHEGHTTLMDEAKKENDLVVVSIFVNPLQFGDQTDLQSYPRDEERDLKLAAAHNVDCIFIPTVEEMYPRQMEIKMKMIARTDQLCGASRPGHFDGVLTVLTKLFNIVQPDQVYFGLKDAQQVAVVDALITQFNFPMTLRGIPTVRETNGLAKSSRNVHLSEEEQVIAPRIYSTIQAMKQLVQQGETNVQTIVRYGENLLGESIKGQIDYLQILTYPSLQPIETVDEQVIIATAIYFEHARLIDNVIIDAKGNEHATL